MSVYLGDFTPGKVVRRKFNTFAKTTSAPITLAGTPTAAVYKDGSTTESTSGVTLTVDFDARTGCHLVAVDTSSDGTFYSAASDFQIKLTAGTVDGESVVGVVVASFSLSNRSALRPTVADRSLDVSAGGEAGVDWANVGSPTSNVALTNTTISSGQIVASAGVVGSVTAAVTLPSIPANWITTAGIANGAFTAAKFAAGALDGKGDWPDALTIAGTVFNLDYGTNPPDPNSYGALLVAQLDAPISGIPLATELRLMNEGDGQAFQDAIVTKIENADLDFGELTVAAIASASATAVWGAGARSLTDKAGFSLTIAPPTTTEIRTALGLGSANLDAQLSAIAAKTTLITSDMGTAATRFLTMIMQDGAVWQLTVNSLENAPAGEGGGGGGISFNDPIVGEAFPAGSFGELVQRLNVGATGGLVLPIPAPSSVAGAGQVYGYFRTANLKAAIGLQVHFDLIEAADDDALISRRRVTATTIQAPGEGYEDFALMTVDLYPGVYRVESSGAKVSKTITVVAGQANLEDL